MLGSTNRVQSAARRYGGALLCTGAALLLRWLLPSAVGDRLPLGPIYLASLISAAYFGSLPGLVSAGFGWLGVAAIWGVPDAGRNVLYPIACVACIWIIGEVKRARTRAEENAQLAVERLERLTEESAARARDEEYSSQLKAIIETSEDAIISKTLDGVIQSWNLGAEKIYGYVAAEAIGQPIAIVIPEERRAEEAEIRERIRHGGLVKHFETVHRRKDGAQIHVSLTNSPILDAAGKIVGASHIARDISERKTLEEQVRQSQKLESLGVMAGGLAHDFNNLLTGIMGNASLALDDVYNGSPAHSRIIEILSAGERAAMLVQQMLAYAGKGRFLVESIDLSAEVREILPLVRTSAPYVVEVATDLEANLPTVDADRSQIQQLIMNLAINAAEAMEGRPGTIGIQTYSRDAGGERQVILRVQDSGSGMSEDVKSKIFDPFFTTKFMGRGLGLAAVNGIIHAHQGSIAVQSEPGIGSTFTVVLPAATPRTTAKRPGPDTDLRGYGNVLVVDDEELVRNMARYTLEQCGYQVTLAVDGKAAVTVFSERPREFAAILLDLTMPVMNGEGALYRIQEIRPDVPVVLSSGYSETEVLGRFEDRGLAGFLQKPYTATALSRKIKQAVRLKTAGPKS